MTQVLTKPARPAVATPRVLVCSADVGCGHGRAATAITKALREEWPALNAEVIDVLTSTPRWFNECYRGMYIRAVKIVPRVMGWLYDRTDAPGLLAERGLGCMIEDRATRVFVASDAVRSADVIICTHFLCASVLSRLIGAGRLRAKLVVVVTDQHPHAVWRVPHADRFIVASDAAALEMVRNGVGRERIAVTGIPIDERFTRTLCKQSIRAKRGLPGDAKIILLCGGGLGLGGLDRAFEAIVASGKPVYTIVVCGKNESLRKKLVRAHGREPSKWQILGQTGRMHELMAAADVMIGKPGGLTTTEAISQALPMVLLRPIPGQETRNATALVNSGAAVLFADPYDAGTAGVALVYDEPMRARMRDRARHIGLQNSAQSAAIEAMSTLSER